MINGRKTTYQERIEIVQYTIANELNYAQAIEKYDVSYQQVYFRSHLKKRSSIKSAIRTLRS